MGEPGESVLQKQVPLAGTLDHKFYFSTSKVIPDNCAMTTTATQKLLQTILLSAASLIVHLPTASAGKGIKIQQQSKAVPIGVFTGYWLAQPFRTIGYPQV
jgi:hypothetical protein